jgi:hypothetical protein
MFGKQFMMIYDSFYGVSQLVLGQICIFSSFPVLFFLLLNLALLFAFLKLKLLNFYSLYHKMLISP